VNDKTKVKATAKKQYLQMLSDLDKKN